MTEEDPGLTVDHRTSGRQKGRHRAQACVQEKRGSTKFCQSSVGDGLESPGARPLLQHTGMQIPGASHLRPEVQDLTLPPQDPGVRTPSPYSLSDLLT